MFRSSFISVSIFKKKKARQYSVVIDKKQFNLSENHFTWKLPNDFEGIIAVVRLEIYEKKNQIKFTNRSHPHNDGKIH